MNAYSSEKKKNKNDLMHISFIILIQKSSLLMIREIHELLKSTYYVNVKNAN